MRSLAGRGAWKLPRRGAGRDFHEWQSRAGGAGRDFHGWNRRRRTPESIPARGQPSRADRGPSFHWEARFMGGPPARVPVEGARSRRGSARAPGRTGLRRAAPKPLPAGGNAAPGRGGGSASRGHPGRPRSAATSTGRSHPRADMPQLITPEARRRRRRRRESPPATPPRRRALAGHARCAGR